MPCYETTIADPAVLKQRPIYGPFKRAKRRTLRAFGRWSRADYDVRFVFEGERIAYKKILFNHAATAARVMRNLERFGPSEHLPKCHRADGRALWMDYIEGRPFDRLVSPCSQEVARCFTEFAARHSYRRPIGQTGLWGAHRGNLTRLVESGLLGDDLHDAILARSTACRPATLRIGFDYRDPIAPNLVARADTGRICAIDVKNWHADTLVGQGLAKTTDRWLDAPGCARVLDIMSDHGLNDVAEGFEFIRLYERIDRLRRCTDTELKTHGRIRKRRAKRARLAALA
ncbi:hypothetical protein [Salinisphaera sp.]|uniref:hypothetical protein n=1 Tax=Salinisphaera sp. TaxID=1914330 RepID=UPI002D7770BE|nr:hypothetical protein [Salinisphaera sp.]HET7312998.1 hypothetical protein [Salinisphaera sp.]